MGIKNFNQPRPKWARATSKFIRTLGVIAGSISWGNESIDGVFISLLTAAIADYILDLFPADEVVYEHELKQQLTVTETPVDKPKE